MRIWLLALLVVVGCKKNAERSPESPSNRGSATTTTSAPAPVDDKLLDTERIGPLRIGMTDAEVTTAIGSPAQKSPTIEEGATGYFVSDWTFDGVALHMAADTKTGPFKVTAISVSKPQHATARGIRVGSTLADLAAAYPRSTEEGQQDPNMFLVGSVYGGLLFKLEKDVVAEIFLGAMAF